MANLPRVDSLALKVIMFFNGHPEEELKTDDIVTKFSAIPTHIPEGLARAVEDGWLRRTNGGGGRGRQVVYAAGEILLEVGSQNDRIYRELREERGRRVRELMTERQLQQVQLMAQGLPPPIRGNLDLRREGVEQILEAARSMLGRDVLDDADRVAIRTVILGYSTTL